MSRNLPAYIIDKFAIVHMSIALSEKKDFIICNTYQLSFESSRK